jgi:hypothetical protein
MTNEPPNREDRPSENVSHHLIPPAIPEEDARIIDLDQIRITALTGVHRASIFMGLGVNAADDPAFISYQLKGPIQISVTPHELSESDLVTAKGHFKNWIIGNGLRELAERFGEFLDQIFDVVIFLEVRTNRVTSDAAAKIRSAFLGDTAISGKLNRLSAIWGEPFPNQQHYSRLTQARNCLVHGLGIVRQRDHNDGDDLLISWRGGDVYLHGEDGTEFRFSEETVGRIAVGNAVFRASDRERRFAVGAEVVLTPHDLQEICAMVQRDTEDILCSLLRHGQLRGAKHLQAELRAK